MDTDRLRELVCIVDAGSYTEAAKRLSLSQSVLSRHVSQLERECGERLLERTNAFVRPTLAGRVFLRGARRVLATVDEAQAHFRMFRKAPHHELAIELFRGYKPTDDLVIALEQHFMRTDLFVDMSLHDVHATDPIAKVSEGLVDIALIGSAPDISVDGLGVAPYIVEPLVAIVGVGHPLAGRDVLTAQDLDGVVVWVSEGPRHLYSHIKAQLAARGVHPDYQTCPWTNAVEMYASMPYDTVGVRLTFASNAHHSIPAVEGRCRSIGFDDPGLTAPVTMVWRLGNDNPACVSAIEYIRHVAETSDLSVYWK